MSRTTPLGTTTPEPTNMQIAAELSTRVALACSYLPNWLALELQQALAVAVMRLAGWELVELIERGDPDIEDAGDPSA